MTDDKKDDEKTRTLLDLLGEVDRLNGYIKDIAVWCHAAAAVVVAAKAWAEARRLDTDPPTTAEARRATAEALLVALDGMPR